MPNIINNNPKGKQISKRIFLLIIIIFFAILIFILYGLATSGKYSIANIKDTVVGQSKDPMASLKDISNSVPAATGKPNIIKENNEKQAKKKEIARQRQQIIEDNYKLEQMKALQNAINSSLSVQGINISRDTAGAAGSEQEKKEKYSSNQKQFAETEYSASNMQGQKNQFLNVAGKNEKTALDQGPIEQRSLLEIKAGTIIPAVLSSGINSDLPGTIIARVRRNVYDTRSGNYILIPQGSTLVGIYSSQIAYGQDRCLMVWSRIIFPDGENLNLEGMPGADVAGYSGLSDKVNNHYFRVFSAAILMSLFTAGIEASTSHWGNTSNATGFDAGAIISGALGLQLGQTGMQMVQRNLNIQPTIEIRPGCEFNVLVTRDIPFRKPYKVEI